MVAPQILETALKKCIEEGMVDEAKIVAKKLKRKLTEEEKEKLIENTLKISVSKAVVALKKLKPKKLSPKLTQKILELLLKNDRVYDLRLLSFPRYLPDIYPLLCNKIIEWIKNGKAGVNKVQTVIKKFKIETPELKNFLELAIKEGNFEIAKLLASKLNIKLDKEDCYLMALKQLTKGEYSYLVTILKKEKRTFSRSRVFLRKIIEVLLEKKQVDLAFQVALTYRHRISKTVFEKLINAAVLQGNFTVASKTAKHLVKRKLTNNELEYILKKAIEKSDLKTITNVSELLKQPLRKKDIQKILENSNGQKVFTILKQLEILEKSRII